MTPPPRARAALSDDDDDDSAAAANADADADALESHQESQSERESEGSRAALRRLQATLTAAMEHMEGAQLEFFHVQRSLAARQRRRRRSSPADAEPSWSVRVRLYADFWARFEAQLRAALAPGAETDRALAALGAVASNVWGETRAPARDAFRDGALVLTPAVESASGEAAPADGAADTGARKKLKATRATPAATAAASAAMERGKVAPLTVGRRKSLSTKTGFRSKEAAEAAAAREKAAEDERRRRKRYHHVGVSPHHSLVVNGEGDDGQSYAAAAAGTGDGSSVTSESGPGDASAAQSPASKRKSEFMKEFGSSSDEDEQATLKLIPVPDPTSDNDVAGDEDGNEVAPVAAAPTNGTKGQRKDEALARMRQLVRARLVDDEVWPNLRLPFPKHLLMFDAKAHAKLASEHETFWRKNIAAFLDVVYSHPTQIERARLHQSKMRLLRRQRVLLTEYIEALGVEEVARNLLSPESRGAFFFVRKYITLEQLSAKQLEEHLAHVHTPWTSPVTQERQIPWWDVFTRKGARQEMIVDASDRVKREIAHAHFHGALEFDATWTRLATQAPWKQMLEALRVTKADEADDGAPQSPPPRKKAAAGVGRVLIKEEHLGATSYASYSPQRGLQERIVMQFSSASDDSSSSDESDLDDSSRQRSSLGKRLRTSSSTTRD